MAAKAQTHTHALAMVGVTSICYNLQALTTRDKEGKTPIDIQEWSLCCDHRLALPYSRGSSIVGLEGDGPLVRTIGLLVE